MRTAVATLRWFVVVLVTLWVAACSAGHPSIAPIAHRAVDPEVTTLVRLADAAFAEFQKPDYRRPLVRGPDVPSQLGALYWRACLAGDLRSCWMADAFTHSSHTEAMVRENCLSGDQPSCRALPYDDWGSIRPDKRLAGWAGRSLSCHTPECREARRRECVAGFPRSCKLEVAVALDLTPFQRRIVEIASEGCRAGILEDCHWLVSLSFHPPELYQALEQLCIMKLTNCTAAYGNDMIETRDFLEHGCQYGSGEEQGMSCRYLERGYSDPEPMYPEPYPGRGLELGRWNCARSRDPAGCLKELARSQPPPAPARPP